jgi:hypothetical protein
MGHTGRCIGGAGGVGLGSVGLALLVAGCAHQASAPSPESAGVHHTTSSARWHAFALPGKARTRYEHKVIDGRKVVHARADRSASMWRQHVRLETQQLGRMHFSWKVPRLIDAADMTDRDGDDAPVRIVLAFDGDRQHLSVRNRMMFDLAESLTGEAPPYATLMYVWDPRAEVGAVIKAPRSDRVRGLVVESGPQRVGRWLHYERDVVADFRRAYGEDPGPLIGVAVMTDSDNTGTETEAFYGQIELLGASGMRLL